MMETVKKNIKHMETVLVGLKSRRKEYKDAGEKIPAHIKIMLAKEEGKLEGIFLGLRLTLTKDEFDAICDWDYELVEKLEKDYNL